MKSLLCTISVFFCVSASAVDFVNVPDASLLKWQLVPGGVAVLRNLNEFDSSFLPCCYNYYFDTTTPAGKAMWAMLMLKHAMAKPISIGVDSKLVPSAITYIGNH